MDKIKEKIEMLDDKALEIPQIVKLAEKVKQKPGHVLLAIVVLVPLLIAMTMGGQIVTVMLTVAYPAIKSMKALDTKDDEEDDK